MHAPVLLNETIKFLDPKPGEIILDATIDGGGHATEILKHILPNGKLVGIDQDKALLETLNSKFKTQNSKLLDHLVLIRGNFRDLDELLESAGIYSVNAALFDLGMSSLQIEESGRGFSFQRNEPLMMNLKNPIKENDLTAEEIVNSWRREDIEKILKEYGEERFAGRISRAIVAGRPMRTTGDLVAAVKKGVRESELKSRLHFATRTFQALRIAVNDELGALEEGLAKAWDILSEGGRLAVVSFHSLEDRVVKNFMREKKQNKKGEILCKKPVRSSTEETKKNPRSRSAKLRAIKKI